MKILAVDTSTRHLSLAVTEGQVLLAARNLRPRKDLALSITADVERVLFTAGISLDDVDAFVIGLGPGSFTGLRVGLSMVKAFAMVTEKPLTGVASLDAIAMNVPSRKPVQVCVINDARRNLLYSALYKRNSAELIRQGEYHLKPVDEILAELSGEVVFTGDGILLYREHIIKSASAASARFSPLFALEKHWLPRAAALARLGVQKLLRDETDSSATLTPLYLYPEDCQVGKKASVV